MSLLFNMHQPFSKKFGFCTLDWVFIMVIFYDDTRLMHKIGKYPKISRHAQQREKDLSFDFMFVQDLLLQYWVHRLQWWAFYNTRNATARKNSASDNVDFSGKLLDTWTSWIFWTFGSLGGALGFLTSRTFWQFRQHGSLGPLDLLAIWILDPLGHFDILWSLWWFKLLGYLFGFFLGKLLNSWYFGIPDVFFFFLVAFPLKRSFGYLWQILSLHN